VNSPSVMGLRVSSRHPIAKNGCRDFHRRRILEESLSRAAEPGRYA
jgi:hypothetical protein